MKIMQKSSGTFSRNVLNVTKRGVVIEHQRAKVGGGWYNRDILCVLWPWIKDGS